MRDERQHRPRLRTLAAALLLAPAWGFPAIAGDGDYEPDDGHDDGPSFFGEAKDVAGMKPLQGVRVRAVVKGSKQSIIAATDEDGRFSIRGVGQGIPVDAVDITCSKDGYAAGEVLQRSLRAEPNARVEVECLLVRR